MILALYANGRFVCTMEELDLAFACFKRMFAGVEFRCESASGYHYIAYVNGEVVGHFLNVGETPDLEISDWQMAG